MTKPRSVSVQLGAAFDVVLKKLQRVVDRLADALKENKQLSAENKQLRADLAESQEDVRSAVVIINPKESQMAKQSPQQAQNSPDGTTIPPATSIRVLGSGQFKLGADEQILLNGSWDAAANGEAVLLSWKGGQLKAQDNTGGWWLWSASVQPEGPQGSWSSTDAP